MEFKSMSDKTVLEAELKEGAGKGAARDVRNAGRTPAVIYGDKKDPVMVSVEPVALWKLLNQPGFYSTVIEVKAGGKSHKVLPRAVQFHKVTDVPLHVDFMRVSGSSRLTVQVPVSFVNEEASPGLKRGAVLNIVRHDVEVICPANAIPANFEIDVTGLDVNDSIHFSMIKMPKGVEPTITDRDFTIATLAAPSGLRSKAAGESAESEEGSEESES
jgi:large subunit ribosomal protein L25